jgi:hypothetical protein
VKAASLTGIRQFKIGQVREPKIAEGKAEAAE